jgi:hypothetical protein
MMFNASVAMSAQLERNPMITVTMSGSTLTSPVCYRWCDLVLQATQKVPQTQGLIKSHKRTC